MILVGLGLLVFVGVVGTVSMNRQIKKIVDKLD
jgi:hypothetical protein